MTNVMIRWFRPAMASLPTDPSGPGVPTLRFWLARMFVSRLTSTSLQSRIACAIGPNPRGRRTEEYLEVLQTLFRGEQAAYAGEFYTVPPSVMAPAPVQAGGPPILLGGTADIALRRAGRLAAGWVSSSRASLADIARGAQIVRRAAEESGRDPDRVRIVVRGAVMAGLRDDDVPLSGTWDQIRAGAQLYAEAGVTELFYDLNWDPVIGSPDADPRAAGERAEQILTALAPNG